MNSRLLSEDLFKAAVPNSSTLFYCIFPLLVALTTLAVAQGLSASSSSSSIMGSIKCVKGVYDVIVIGGGSAGLTAAKLSSHTLKQSCLLVEADRLGADCTWTGCIPSKSLLAAAKAMHGAKQLGVVTKNAKADWSAVTQQIAANIQQIYDADDSPETLERMGVTVVKGRAVITSPKSISITISEKDNSQPLQVTAKEGIILCTGAKPRIPTDDVVPGLSTIDYLTYESIWTQLGDDIPNRLTIVGGGPIGCELGQAFARLGAKVTIVADRLLPYEDVAVGELLEQVFVQEGITICKGRLVKVQAVGAASGSAASTKPRQHTCVCDSGTAIEGDVLLLAVGRVPRCSDMGLEAVGVELTPNQEAIAVNSKLQTTVKGIYAAGDCTGDRQFTHYAGYQGAIAARNILLPLTDPGVLEHVPATTFTSPEVATIGISEDAAVTQHGRDKIVVAQRQLSHVDRAVCDGNQQGFIKIVYLKKNGRILGATIVSPSAGEMISEIAVMMKTGMPFEQLATVMHPYPTYAFALQLMAADAYYEKTLKSKWLLDILKRIGL